MKTFHVLYFQPFRKPLDRLLSFCKCFVPVSGVTILLSLTVFSQIVAETMPATSDAVPLLGNPIERKRIPKRYFVF
jgi:hypothetical protein